MGAKRELELMRRRCVIWNGKWFAAGVQGLFGGSGTLFNPLVFGGSLSDVSGMMPC